MFPRITSRLSSIPTSRASALASLHTGTTKTFDTYSYTTHLVRRTMASSSTPTPTPTPIVELREYALHPSHVVPYTKSTTEASTLRKSLTPLRLFSMPETGGMLNTATHMYYFQGGFSERTERRKGMGKSEEWKMYLKSVKPCMISQKSSIFVEAPLVKEFEEVPGLECGTAESMLEAASTSGSGSGGDDDPIYEIRRYHLKLGYDTVPQFLTLYAKGLPSKLHAPGTDPTTTLITLLYSEVGQLNEVIEVWRHGSMDAMERSRVAARGAQEWRSSIAAIADLANVFTNTIHKPLSFSPLR